MLPSFGFALDSSWYSSVIYMIELAYLGPTYGTVPAGRSASLGHMNHRGSFHVSSLGDMKTGNPMFTMGGSVFDDWARVDRRSTTLSVQGTAAKAVVLLAILVVCAAISWGQAAERQLSIPMMIGAGIGATLLSIATVFLPQYAFITAPLFAAAEGFVLGAISSLLNLRYPGIAMQAVAFTFGTAATMFFLYSTRLVQVTEGFTRMVLAGTGALCFVYLLGFLLSFFGINLGFFGSGPLGLIVSVVALSLAAMNLLLDFDFIEQQADRGAPKNLEWYCAFSLVLTLAWLYLEILKLLAKLQDRR